MNVCLVNAHLFLYIIVNITAISDCFGSSLIFIDFQFEFHLERMNGMVDTNA